MKKLLLVLGVSVVVGFVSAAVNIALGIEHTLIQEIGASLPDMTGGALMGVILASKKL